MVVPVAMHKLVIGAEPVRPWHIDPGQKAQCFGVLL